jgi:hypothetical protein
MIGKPHIVTPEDVARGIQALAQQLLGNASEWPTLVSINNLAPPYLTLDPSQVYGPPVATTTLSAQVSAGATTIILPNQPQSTNTLYLSSVSSAGIVAESAGVSSYISGVFALASPLQNTYPTGSRVQLFSTYATGGTQVLLPGSVIYVSVTNSSSLTLTSTAQLTDVFGGDISATFGFTNGDLTTVQGIGTLDQRFSIALQTELSSLPLHPDFGSGVPGSVGRTTTQTKWAALVREALTKLPEVASVQSVSVVPQGDKAYVSAIVYVHTSGVALELQTVALTLVG